MAGNGVSNAAVRDSKSVGKIVEETAGSILSLDPNVSANAAENGNGNGGNSSSRFTIDVDEILSSPAYPSNVYMAGGSSTSRSSAPRIYSYTRNVGSNKPSTMYSKNPQSPRTIYLNPSFETKGSREAYKRQDI